MGADAGVGYAGSASYFNQPNNNLGVRWGTGWHPYTTAPYEWKFSDTTLPTIPLAGRVGVAGTGGPGPVGPSAPVEETPDVEVPVETPVAEVTPDLCPNSVFENGKMYDGNVQYTDNTCNNETQKCESVYFYHAGAYTSAICSDGEWISNW